MLDFLKFPGRAWVGWRKTTTKSMKKWWKVNEENAEKICDNCFEMLAKDLDNYRINYISFYWYLLIVCAIYAIVSIGLVLR